MRNSSKDGYYSHLWPLTKLLTLQLLFFHEKWYHIYQVNFINIYEQYVIFKYIYRSFLVCKYELNFL